MSGFLSFKNDPVFIVAGADDANAKEWKFDNAGNIILPQGGNILNYSGSSVLNPLNTGNISFNADTISNSINNNDINITVNSSILGNLTWNFSPEGKLTLPENGQIIQNFSITKTTTFDLITPLTPTIIWSSDSVYTSTAKLLIMLEQDPGDSSPDHVQSCEAMIAAKGAGGIGPDVPTMSVYGIVSTSIAALATFSVQRNATTKKIEVLATLNNTNEPAYIRINSVELLSRG